MSRSEQVSVPAPVAPEAPQWRRVSLFLTGQGVSLAGDQVFFVAASWAAAQLGGNGAVTVVTLAMSIPRALAMVFGGAACDALGPRAVLLRATSTRVVVLAGAAAAATMGRSVPLLAAVAAVEGTMLGLGSPSFGSLMPRMVPREQLARANSVRTMVGRLAPIVGSPAGAWLVASGHLAAALATVAATCAVSLVCMFSATSGMRATRTTMSGLLRRSADGFALLRADRRMLWLFLSALCLDLAFAWPLNPALPVVMVHRGWGVEGVGAVLASFGAGALASAALGTALGERIPVRVRLVGSAAGVAIGLLAMILMPSLAAMAAVAAALGAFSGQNGPAVVTLYQRVAPPERLGTAMSMLALSGIGAAPIAYALFGGLAGLVGPTPTWIACGVIALGSPFAGLRAITLLSPAEA